MKNRNIRNKGFTLIEMMIAIAIIGVLTNFFFQAPRMLFGSLSLLQIKSESYSDIRSSLDLLKLDIGNSKISAVKTGNLKLNILNNSFKSDILSGDIDYSYEKESGTLSRNNRIIMKVDNIRFSRISNGVMINMTKGGREWLYWFPTA